VTVRAAPAGAIGALGLTVALAAATVVLAPSLSPAEVSLLVTEVLAFAGSGALVAARRPRLPAGWLLLAVGLVWTVVAALDAYVRVHPSPLPAWLLNWVWVPAFTALTLFLLTFPDGRWLGPAWRGAGWVAITGGVLLIVSRTLEPGSLTETPTIANPIGLDSWGLPLGLAEKVGNLATAGSGIAAALLLAVRYRRADPTTRRQLLWMALAGLVWVLVATVANALELFGVEGVDVGDVFIASFAAVPVAAAVAIGRYRLYDIDVIVGRTVVVGGVVAFITIVYLVVVIGIGTAVGRTTGSNLFLGVVATALVAVGVQPLRQRLVRVARGLLQPPVSRSEQEGLAIRTLGAFRVLRDGEPVPATAWQSRKARTLVKVLLARRGRATPREQLMEILWRNEESEVVSRRLSVALATARAVLDPEKRHPPDHVLAADQGSLRIDLAHVQVDVEAFLVTAGRGLAANRLGEAEAGPLLTRARDLYTGDFLEEDRYDDWAQPLREEARAALRSVLVALADRGDDAPGCYLRMLELDEFDEPAHLGLVRALDATGRRGEAQRRYRHYVERMAHIQAPAQPYPARLNLT
jgi:DNA-binding SARP family transcriptional activator